MLRGHDKGVHSAAFSPDGTRIVTASLDQSARLWDAATAKEIAILRGHDDAVNSAAFSPDGRRIVTASRDKTARLWDAATAKEIAVLRGHDKEVHSAAFSPDGTRIVTASDDKTVRLWDVHLQTMSMKDLLAEACARLAGPFLCVGLATATAHFGTGFLRLGARTAGVAIGGQHLVHERLVEPAAEGRFGDLNRGLAVD